MSIDWRQQSPEQLFDTDVQYGTDYHHAGPRFLVEMVGEQPARWRSLADSVKPEQQAQPGYNRFGAAAVPDMAAVPLSWELAQAESSPAPRDNRGLDRLRSCRRP